MKLQHHIAVSIPISIGVGILFQSNQYAIISFLAGVFIDLDHLFDYFREYGFPWNLKKFFYRFHNHLFKRLVLPFHAYENLIIFGAITFWTTNPVLFSIMIGVSQHMIFDQLTNGIKPQAYLITYRIFKKFDAPSVFNKDV
ncbi:MAG: hypothetical protein AABY84_03955 [Candidatus Firestonebacteria bacterium]|mgnify:CR=1 FL=1